jgi:hypothetical protein
MLENLDYNRILAMLPVGLIGFMLPQVLEEGFYADPPKNKLDSLIARLKTQDDQMNQTHRWN